MPPELKVHKILAAIPIADASDASSILVELAGFQLEWVRFWPACFHLRMRELMSRPAITADGKVHERATHGIRLPINHWSGKPAQLLRARRVLVPIPVLCGR